MTKLDAGLITSLPASDPGSAAVWGSKRINPRPQFCLCLAWSGCPSNDDDDDDEVAEGGPDKVHALLGEGALLGIRDRVESREGGRMKVQGHHKKASAVGKDPGSPTGTCEKTA